MNSVLDISNQRQLFVDSVLIDKTTVEARLELAKPELQEGVLETTDPRERNTCSCYSLFRDGAYMRLYYRGSHFIKDENRHAGHGVLCYAHSRDGVHWKRPQGELFAFNGSTKNNIVLYGTGSHNFTPFIDQTPDVGPMAATRH